MVSYDDLPLEGELEYGDYRSVNNVCIKDVKLHEKDGKPYAEIQGLFNHPEDIYNLIYTYHTLETPNEPYSFYCEDALLALVCMVEKGKQVSLTINPLFDTVHNVALRDDEVTVTCEEKNDTTDNDTIKSNV